MTNEQILQNIETHYIPLTEACKTELIKSSKVLFISDKDTIIVNEGDYADKSYFIAKGVARAYYLKDGKDVTDWFAFENDFICSINSFFMDIPSPHYIEVLEESVLLEISRDNVSFLSEKYIDFDRLNKMVIIKTMLQQQHRIVSLQFETALQKYHNLLKTRPDITQRVPLTHIASYLGITLETLSRIRNPKY
ncbi:MAG: Crp/Fnr family transcriptional regulator [Limnohabitans sp.]|nr:Crp/Fnr family transcriptional regulator [Limnohabitans sp.]